MRLLSVIFSVLLFGIVSAEDFGVVDMSYIAANSKAHKSASSQLEKYESDLRASFDEDGKKLQTLQDELRTKRDEFSPKELQKKRNRV